MVIKIPDITPVPRFSLSLTILAFGIYIRKWKSGKEELNAWQSGFGSAATSECWTLAVSILL